MATTEERLKEVKEMLESTNKHLMEKSPLLITVDVPTPEAVEAIMRWFYAKDEGPMDGAKIQLISWDQEIVTKREALAVRMIREGDQFVDVDMARDSIRDSILRLRTEVNCRIEHGAEHGGHLEFVQGSLDAILKQEDDDARTGV